MRNDAEKAQRGTRTGAVMKNAKNTPGVMHIVTTVATVNAYVPNMLQSSTFGGGNGAGGR